jgi:hypothetical protein
MEVRLHICCIMLSGSSAKIFSSVSRLGLVFLVIMFDTNAVLENADIYVDNV